MNYINHNTKSTGRLCPAAVIFRMLIDIIEHLSAISLLPFFAKKGGIYNDMRKKMG
jgi:hypothetical protein